MNDSLEVNNNEQAEQFELFISGCRCFIDYKMKDNLAYLNHTEVPSELSGQGVGSVLVTKTLQYLEDQGIKVVPGCSYIQHYLQRHPEWMRIIEKY